MVDHEKLSQALIKFSRNLVSEYQVTDILYQLCDHVVEILPISGAGVMLEDDDGHLRFVSASDEVVRAIEALQIELGEGPCLHSYRRGEQVVVPDLSDTEWFPKFASRALEAGLKAVYSFPLRIGDERIGALNLYRDQPGEFADDDAQAGQVLADVATTYIINSRAKAQSDRLAQQLQHALDSRVVIEQAKGKIAERNDVDVGQAFELLRGYARENGKRLHAVAEKIVRGDLDLPV